MMTPREYLAEYVKKEGGAPEVAKNLGIPYSTLAAILNGYRGISAQMADRMHAADPMIDRNQIVWVRATKAEAA
jgi:plasmid maintenance system antidote protein VapI